MPDPQQPPVQGLLIPLKAELRSESVDRAVREGHPGSGGDHAHVHAHGDLIELRHGGLQGPVVLTAIQHGLSVPQEIPMTFLIWDLKLKLTKEKKITRTLIYLISLEASLPPVVTKGITGMYSCILEVSFILIKFFT